MKMLPVDMGMVQLQTLPPLFSDTGSRRREEAEDYFAVVAKLNDKWRVIVCRDAIQWILQRRAGTRLGLARWEARTFNRTRDGLLHRVIQLAGECDATALQLLENLPAYFGGRA